MPPVKVLYLPHGPLRFLQTFAAVFYIGLSGGIQLDLIFSPEKQRHTKTILHMLHAQVTDGVET